MEIEKPQAQVLSCVVQYSTVFSFLFLYFDVVCGVAVHRVASVDGVWGIPARASLRVAQHQAAQYCST